MESNQGKDKAAGKKGGTAKKSETPVAAKGKESSGKKEFDIDIFRGWCKSCGICAAFCPKECIRLDPDGTPMVDDSGRCSGCGWCELHCPDFAISVREKNSEKLREQDA